MIQQRTATQLTRVSPMAAAILAAGLTVGFVAGQAAPDILDSLFGSAATVESLAPALTEADDYATRHLTMAPSLTEADDYATRHLTIATAPLTRADDYATRHLQITPLNPADDYGVRHP